MVLYHDIYHKCLCLTARTLTGLLLGPSLQFQRILLYNGNLTLRDLLLALSPADCSAFGEVCSSVTVDVLVWNFLLFYLYAYNVKRGDISKVIHGSWEVVYFGASQKSLDNSVTVFWEIVYLNCFHVTCT